MTRYPVRVGLVIGGFAVGALIISLVISVIGPIAIRNDQRGPDLRFELLLPVMGVFSIIGALGGACLRKGWRPVIESALVFGVLGLWSGLIATFRQIFSGPFYHRFDVVIAVIGAFSMTGAIGGASLRRGWKAVIGFGLVFGLLGAVMLDWIQEGWGESRPRGSMISWSPIFGIIFLGILCALAGAIGAAISRLGWRLVLAGAAAFGGAGAIAQVVYSILFEASWDQKVYYNPTAMPWEVNYGVNYIEPGIPKFWVFLVPLLITFALGGASFALAAEYRSYKRTKLGLCLKCGYDLRGLTELRCPECGTPFQLSVNKPLEHQS